MENVILTNNQKEADQMIGYLDALATEYGHGDNGFRISYFTGKSGRVQDCPFDTVYLSDTGLEKLKKRVEIISDSLERTIWA